MVIKNKRGWTEILEAFIAVMLVAAVILIAITKGNSSEDLSEKIYKVELSILREIQTDDNLRAEIGSIPISSFPVSWNNVPLGLKARIIERTPTYLECTGKICSIEDVCNIDEKQTKSVYSQSAIISATLQYGIGYRKIMLFCWQKG
jgi:hypothetical protein